MQIKNLIQAFLVDQYNKKSEVPRKKRKKQLTPMKSHNLTKI